jgi:hypothetical protein
MSEHSVNVNSSAMGSDMVEDEDNIVLEKASGLTAQMGPSDRHNDVIP